MQIYFEINKHIRTFFFNLFVLIKYFVPFNLTRVLVLRFRLQLGLNEIVSEPVEAKWSFLCLKQTLGVLGD